MKILNNEYIEDQYKYYIENLTEQIKNKKKYVNQNEPNYFEIICDDFKFKNFIIKKLLDLSKDNFEKKIISIDYKDIQEIMKDNKIINQINALFWIEQQLNINRYEFYNINSKINIDNIKKIFINNIDKYFCIFNDGRTVKYITTKINNIIFKINTINKLQKFYADIINIICYDTIKINSIKKKY